jgi:hypothetical protein
MSSTTSSSVAALSVMAFLRSKVLSHLGCAANLRKRASRKPIRSKAAELADDVAAREKIATTLDLEAFMNDYQKNREASLRYWESKE